MTIKRRDLLQLMAIAATAGVALPTLAESRIGWRNWSGNQSCLPEFKLAPATVEELQDIVASATGEVRAVGAGHSFSPLVPTEGTLLSVDRLQGLYASDDDLVQATFGAGTRLSGVGAPLDEVNQALVNMPDVDEQTLAGAMATGTHGTGAGLNGLPAYLSGLEVVTASGERVQCSATENSDLFAAARVSLGSVGIVSRVSLQNQRPYRLRRQSWMQSWDDTLAQAEELANTHRNFEFYYIPFSQRCLLHAHDVSDAVAEDLAREDENDALDDLKMIRDYLGWSNLLRALPIQALAAVQPREDTIARSWLSYASERNVRFNEMEYHLPREDGLKALAEVKAVLEANHSEVFFPIEVRYVAADDIWLSPFQGRDSLSIAVHRYFDEDYEPYFAAIEPIFRKYGGRPHWGKINTLKAGDFAALYPHWNDFLEVRREYDPQGRFLNAYLKSLLVAGA